MLVVEDIDSFVRKRGRTERGEWKCVRIEGEREKEMEGGKQGGRERKGGRGRERDGGRKRLKREGGRWRKKEGKKRCFLFQLVDALFEYTEF